MAVFSRVKNWVSNEVLTASDLNAEFNNILSNMQPTGIEDQSSDVAAMQANTNPGTVGSESLATNLAGELQRLRFKIKEIIGGAQWYSAPTSTLGAGGIVTASLADGAVTQSKRAALGQQVSSACNSYTFFNGSSESDYTDVTNLSVTITTTGRPVLISLIPNQDVNGIQLLLSANGDTIHVLKVRMRRDSTTVATYLYQIGAASGSTDNLVGLEPRFFMIDTPSAGTYVYKIQGYSSLATSGSASISNCKLMAFEL